MHRPSRLDISRERIKANPHQSKESIKIEAKSVKPQRINLISATYTSLAVETVTKLLIWGQLHPITSSIVSIIGDVLVLRPLLLHPNIVRNELIHVWI